MAGKIAVLDQISAIGSGELSGEEDGYSILETAYIQVFDNRSFDTSLLPTSVTKSILSGLSTERNDKIAQSNTIKVQFNPQTLTFGMTQRDKIKVKADISNSEAGDAQTAPAEEADGQLRVSMELIFDRTIYIDSSVQPEVERFLALIKNPFVRQVAFYWGKMCYKGVVKSISAEYVLFNTLGTPTRAKVSLTIEIK